MCQNRIISKHACAEEDGRKYNTDGTDLTNTGPHSMLFSQQKNKALTCTSSKLLSQTSIDAFKFLSSNQISDLVWACSLGVKLSCLDRRSSTLPWLCYRKDIKDTLCHELQSCVNDSEGTFRILPKWMQFKILKWWCKVLEG